MSPPSLARMLLVNHPDPDVRRRCQLLVTIDLILLGFFSVASVILLFQQGQRSANLGLLLMLALGVGSLYLAFRGRITVGACLLLGPMLVVPPAIVIARGNLIVTLFFLALSVFVSSLILRPWQVLVTGGLAMLGLGLVALRVPPNPVDGFLYPNLIIGPALMVIQVTLFGYLGARAGRMALDASEHAQAEAVAARAALEGVNGRLEAEVAGRTAELQRALAELSERAEAQERLLAEVSAQREVIREMSVPVLPVAADTLIMPLVGALDSRRLHELQSQALAAVERARARQLILDITGVPVVDTQVAAGLVETIKAVGLLGARALLVGIRPEVAQTIVGLGVTLDGVRTEATLQGALAHR